jgi:hypothetical protein
VGTDGRAICGTDIGREPDGLGAGAKFGAEAGWPLLATPGEETEVPSEEESLVLMLKLLARFLGT